MKRVMQSLSAALLAAGFICSGVQAVPEPAPDPALQRAIADPARSPKFTARDRYRHPAEELSYLGVKPNMTVVEVAPGGGYWTEILGPYLKGAGHYYAVLPVRGESEEEDQGAQAWRKRFEDQPDRFGHITVTHMGKGHYEAAPPGSADMILTFRNFHNWVEAGYAEEMLKGFYKALKPGGILGIEDHRGRNDQPQDPKAKSGYVRQDYVEQLAKKAGFELAGSSELLANPKDTKDWPQGVWTLPPTLALGDKDREKYVAIGEADNFLLKFRKPQH
ncbi:MAG: class I SAM-dependent methyltransferase [Sinobacteraceae bacterium]|nr:class I SAM-dependent methyltransferase [Nevskiaceae bacterium]MBV9911898.1 class I SAM-dependent methyltransferase [Nevskiaceae bacterium]